MPGSPSATPRSPTSRSAASPRGSRAERRLSAAGWEKAARSRPSTSKVSSGSTSTPRPTGDAPSTRSSPWSPANRWIRPVSRLVNRRLSGPILFVLLRAGVSPGAATVATFALAAAAVLALGVAWLAALVLGGVCSGGVHPRRSGRGDRPRLLRESLFGGSSTRCLTGRLTPCSPRWRSPPAWTRPAGGRALRPLYDAAVRRRPMEAAYRRPPPRPISPINAGRDVRLLVVFLSAVALQPPGGLVALAILTNAEAVQRSSAPPGRARPTRAPIPERGERVGGSRTMT